MCLTWVAVKYNIVFFPVYGNTTLLLLLLLFFFSVSYYYSYWLISHLFLYELPLATTQNVNVAQSRNIGWQLADNKSASRLVVILFCFASLISLPYFLWQQVYNLASFNVISQSIANLLQFSGLSISGFLWSFLSFFSLSFELLVNTLIMPIASVGMSILLSIILHISIPILDSNTTLSLLHFALNTALFNVFRALLIPFWQSLKAVTYYRLNLPPENTN